MEEFFVKLMILKGKQFSFGLTIFVLVCLIAYNIFGIRNSIQVNATKNLVDEGLLPIFGVSSADNKIALTFDCAWENSDTQRLIDILDEYDVKATFFATGDWCERYPEDVLALFNEGHAIENHSNSHPHVQSIAKDKLIADTTACDDIIESIIGVRPTLYRAPYGEFSDSMLSVFENELPHKVIQWTVDSRDWQGREAVDMAHTVISSTQSGGIMLFHNDTINTPDALEIVLPTLQQDGFEFVLVKDLILWENYQLDHQGLQILK